MGISLLPRVQQCTCTFCSSYYRTAVFIFIACMIRSYIYVRKENESVEPNVLAGHF